MMELPFRTTAVFLMSCSFVSLPLAGRTAAAEKPLHVAIDELVNRAAGDVVLADPSTDAEFMRRIYLDLAGHIPTPAESQQFLSSESAQRRSELIDRLLTGPDYPRRMQELFHVMLMERRGEHEEWTKFLRTAFSKNTPWDQVARAIVRPNADDEATRGAAYFVTSRLVSEGAMAPVDIPGLTRDFGRLLAGVDLRCAQCHDHVSIGDYRQVDFQGLHMVFENVQTRRDVPFPAVAEKVMTKEKEFMSVFIQTARTTSPRVPGAGEIKIATFEKGEEFAVAPDRTKRTPGIPKFSPLGQLADKLASPDNQLFCRNIANRLWFVMMGRGLVEPLDVHHSDNPPSHPELLELLASQFAAHQFDIRWFLRELALTDCYQRSSVSKAEALPAAGLFAMANEKRLSAEQLFWSTLIATGELDSWDGEQVEATIADSDPLTELKEQFLKVFANSPKVPETDFAPTVKAALYLMHDDAVQQLLKPKDGNLVGGLSKIEDAQEIADQLFLQVVSRPPTDSDVADVKELLAGKAGAERSAVIGRIVWALLSSTEYCVNH